MKKIIATFLMMPFMSMAQNQMNNQIDSVSYLIGTSFGQNLLENIPEINLELLLEGISDKILEKEERIIDEYELIITKYFQEKQNLESAGLKAEGIRFMDSIAMNNEQINKTESGLLYEVLKKSKGKKPIETDMVRVHYRGTTPSGEVFDSSYDRGEPIDFTLNQVIKGWTEGLQLMSVGSKYKFYIPQDLAYGEMAPPGSIIKPFMPLVFEVELIDIIK